MTSAVGTPDARQPSADAPTGRAAARRAERAGSSRPWIGPFVVLVVATVARMFAIGSPNTLMFDETYYVKDAWTLWHLGYEAAWPDNPDVAFNTGHVNGYLTTAEFAAHPPLGKWLIGIGEILTGGANSAGWRIAVAVAGVLAVALLMLVAHRLFRSRLVTVVAGGLFAIDNQAITLSRISLLDNFVMLFALIGFVCIVEDRFFVERRVGVWLYDRGGPPGGWGPTLLWRPWLLGAGAAFGLCSGVKWSGLYFLVAFVIYSVLVDMMLRRRIGIRFWYSASLLKQLPATLLAMMPIAVASYLLCWTGYLVTRGGWDREYVAQGNPRFTGLLAWVPDSLQGLWQWHMQIYAFHIGLDAKHPYMAPAILWPLIARPTSMYAQNSATGQNGCQFDYCVAAINDIPNPLIWYAAVAATIYLIVRFIRKHEWQAGALLVAIAAGYVPWLLVPRRTIFFFYSIAFEPYLLLCLAATIGLLLARSAPSPGATDIERIEAFRSLRIRRIAVGVFLGLALVVSIFYYPLNTGMQLPYWLWHIHMWSPTWV